MHTEAVCAKCGETFLPSGDEATSTDAAGAVTYEHYQTEAETPCSGFGPIVGTWYTPAELAELTNPKEHTAP